MAAFASALRDPPTVRVTVEEMRLRVHVKVVGPVTGPMVSERISRLFRDRPELTAYDMLYDLSGYTGAVRTDEVHPIVEAYFKSRPEPQVPCRTAFLTTDDEFARHWPAAMDQQFPGREHRAFANLSSALRYLDEPLMRRRR